MSQQNTKDPNIITLKNVRLSYPQLFKAKAIEEGGKEKYSATFLLNKKEHAALIKEIETVRDRVALDFFKKKVTLKRALIRDGNEKEETEGYGDEVMFISASSEKRPVVVDRDMTTLEAQDGRPYGGCRVNGRIRLYAYDHPKGGKGVSADLRGVQFFKDDTAFGAGPVNAEDEFEAVSDDVDGY